MATIVAKEAARRGPVAVHGSLLERIMTAYDIAERNALTPPQAAVLLCIAFHDGAGRGAWPSIRVMASKTRLSRRTVIRALSVLCNRGLLIRHPRPGKPTRYKVLGGVSR